MRCCLSGLTGRIEITYLISQVATDVWTFSRFVSSGDGQELAIALTYTQSFCALRVDQHRRALDRCEVGWRRSVGDSVDAVESGNQGKAGRAGSCRVRLDFERRSNYTG